VTDLDLPADALVLLVGAAGSGKSTLAARWFDPADVLSSDAYRVAVSGDANDQAATDQAFARLHADLDRRLVAGQLTVVDATNVLGWARHGLLEIAARHGRPAIALVLAPPVEVALARNAARKTGRVPASVVRRHDRQLRASLPRLREEGLATVVVLTDAGQVEALRIRRQRNVPKERHPTL
jgi:protein phosphatase